jgi:hypothetical protein
MVKPEWLDNPAIIRKWLSKEELVELREFIKSLETQCDVRVDVDTTSTK